MAKKKMVFAARATAEITCSVLLSDEDPKALNNIGRVVVGSETALLSERTIVDSGAFDRCKVVITVDLLIY